jgi:hypothetical protein
VVDAHAEDGEAAVAARVGRAVVEVADHRRDVGLGQAAPRATKTSPQKKDALAGSASRKCRIMITPPATATVLRGPQIRSATQPPGSVSR